MIYHGIRFSLKLGVGEEEVVAGLAAMRAASLAIPTIRSFVIGRDIGGEYDYGAVSVIDDLAGYEEMMNHPSHLEVDRLGLPLIDRFASFDITDDPDPDLGAKIAEVHRRRYAGNPDVADLVSDLGEYSGSAAPGPHAS
ncbi:Dabb family protein [Umezawaea endophytica]|uniref:Dabb family protein n=1 Tax=Umezawaea endophytica TaxID=1654476 RepID=A0A9X2VJX0_9PSEU|nr:Dabb family protein [Umezawaea endophytica]MCS7478008.1 Dabb family protein [Umezawaea endophytica]